MFRRFQSAVPNRRGAYPGVFAMVNGLLCEGLLSSEDAAWVRAANERANAAYTDPSTVIADCYDRQRNPGARSWFRADAADLLAFTQEYLALLDRCEVPWTELRTSAPGRIVYEDEVQVVAVPLTFEEAWPLRPS